MASNARIQDPPLMMHFWTAMNYHSLCSNDQKQFEMMMRGVQIKKKFENWLRFEED
jgi:hypothetical protein